MKKYIYLLLLALVPSLTHAVDLEGVTFWWEHPYRQTTEMSISVGPLTYEHKQVQSTTLMSEKGEPDALTFACEVKLLSARTGGHVKMGEMRLPLPTVELKGEAVAGGLELKSDMEATSHIDIAAEVAKRVDGSESKEVMPAFLAGVDEYVKLSPSMMLIPFQPAPRFYPPFSFEEENRICEEGKLKLKQATRLAASTQTVAEWRETLQEVGGGELLYGLVTQLLGATGVRVQDTTPLAMEGELVMEGEWEVDDHMVFETAVRGSLSVELAEHPEVGELLLELKQKITSAEDEKAE